jgi:hypothetical protein
MNPTQTLEQRIATLFRAGQKPVEYMPSIVSETMMTMYLAKKHQMVDPSIMDVQEKYREYSRLTERLRSKMGPPQHCLWELYLYFDEKERLIRDNRKEYRDQFYWKLRYLIDANPGKKVVCLFNIGLFTNDVVTNGHLEIVVFDPAFNTLEHIDSNQLPKQRRRRDPAYFECCEISKEIVREVARMLEEQPIFISNDDIYSGYDYGIQSLEAGSDLLTEVEQKGYCLMWAILFADLALSYPDESMKNIIQRMMKKADSKLTKVEYINDYLAGVIRGFVVEITRTLDVDFTNEESLHEACIRLSKEQKQNCIYS